MPNDDRPSPSPSLLLSPSNSGLPAGTSGTRTRRSRAARACDACRLKKNKCNDTYPCAYCRKHGLECLFQGQAVGQRIHSIEYVKSLEEKAKRLAVLEQRLKDQEGPNTALAPSLSQPILSTPQDDGEFGPGDSEESFIPTGPDPHVTQEVSGINQHTHNVEFYGSSSAVAVLSQVHHAGNEAATSKDTRDAGDFVSSLHNPAFSPSGQQTRDQLQGVRGAPRFRTGHYYQCRTLLLNFFSTIHHIHPILDKAHFLECCDKLHAEDETGQVMEVSSFSALYYSVLSLGALLGPREDEPIDGIQNIDWSRAFFQEVVKRLYKLGMVTDLNMVQCYFMMAKVCQNELNPHLAYMYTGLAVRTALAMGINRESRSLNSDMRYARGATRTWWGLYSLEVEMSFAIGRPDTLGADSYHNRQFPLIKDDDHDSSAQTEPFEHPKCAIIKSMVDLSRIIKNIGLGIYNSQTVSLRTVGLAYKLIEDLENWVASLPTAIQPPKQIEDLMSLKSTRDAQWARRQRLVLTMRYLNLRTLTFGSFILAPISEQRSSILRLSDAQSGLGLSLDAARHTIEIVFAIYQHSDYFRTWFYNTTYVSFAASVILVYAIKDAKQDEIKPLLDTLEKAIGVLESMDECVVAQKSAKLLQLAKEKVKAKLTRDTTQFGMEEVNIDFASQVNHYWGWGPFNFLDGDMNADLPFLFDQTDGGLNQFEFNDEMPQ